MPYSNGYRWSKRSLKIVAEALKRSASVAEAMPEIRRRLGAEVSSASIRTALERAGTPCSKLLGRRVERSWMIDEEKLQAAIAALRRHPTIKAALPEISKVVGRRVRAATLNRTLEKAGLPSASTYCRKPGALDEGERLRRLVALVGKTPVDFAALCDKLDLPPAKTKDLIDQARAQGLRVHVEHDHVGLKFDEPREQIDDLRVAPTVGREQVVAVITDTHLGSKYCLRPQLREFVEYAYAQGAREVLHCGDVLDGDYRHAKFEMSHVGIQDQSADLFETLPRKRGLTYHMITGNHDHTFAASSGVDVGEYVENYFASRGRRDLKFHGNRSAYLQLRGAVVHLWHPRKGVAYALSYGIQKQIEKYAAIKPQVLLVGHWHVFAYVVERGIHALACGTFQGGGSEFSKSLGGAPAIGGTILRWTTTTEGTIRGFSVERRSYFEVERPVRIYNELDAIPVG